MKAKGTPPPSGSGTTTHSTVKFNGITREFQKDNESREGRLAKRLKVKAEEQSVYRVATEGAQGPDSRVEQRYLLYFDLDDDQLITDFAKIVLSLYPDDDILDLRIARWRDDDTCYDGFHAWLHLKTAENEDEHNRRLSSITIPSFTIRSFYLVAQDTELGDEEISDLTDAPLFTLGDFKDGSAEIIAKQEAKMEAMQRLIDAHKRNEASKDEIITNKNQLVVAQANTMVSLAEQVASLKELVCSQNTVIALLQPADGSPGN